ncbi:genetic suppressor element 1-like isoform X1 [Hemitrygon akajei]|uniref:genetic suppressor element 1-like isoform X1 n=2 Tax=Hemitrygon akajei TaxID=2704970 RepID=UPI003BF964DC
MASSYTARYLQMKLKDPRRAVRQSAEGMSHEPKSSALSIISATQRTTATVNPLTASALNGPVVRNDNQTGHGTPNIRGGHTASFAAALRKLAKQAEEPRGSLHCSEHSPISSPVANHGSPAGTPKRAPGTIIVPPGTQRVANTPPVVTIAPTQTINGLWRGDGRQPSGRILRSRSSDHPLSTESLLKRDKSPVPTHAALSHPAFYLSSHPIQDSPYSTINFQRPVPHLVTSSSRANDFLTCFRPYHEQDEMQTLSSLPSMGLNSTTANTAATFYHPAFLPHLPYQHPPYRIDDPYFLSLRQPFYHIPQPGTISSIQATNMQLSLTGMRGPSGIAQKSFSGIPSDHLSVHTARRLQVNDELREQEKAPEHEKKDWKQGVPQEREAEVLTEKGRKREKQQEMEWEKEIKRRKEMKQEKDLKTEYGSEKNVALSNDTAKRHVEEWKSAMEQLEKVKQPSPGSGKVRTLSLEPIALPVSSSLLSIPSNISSYSSTSEGRYALYHHHHQQRMDKQPGYGVYFHQHHLQHLHREQGHLFSEQKQDRSRSLLKDPNQHQPLHIGVPPPLISPQYPLKETSPQLRPFISAHALQPAQALNYSTNYSKVNHDSTKDSERHQDINMRNDASNKTAGEHFNPPLPKSCTDKYMNENKKSGISSLGLGTGPHLKGQSSNHQSINHISTRHLEELQEECLDLSTTSGATDLSQKNKKITPVPNRYTLYSNDATTSRYNDELLLQQPVVSKIDLAEKKLKEARMNGEFSGCNSSDEIFCKGDMRNRICSQAEQPPLKRDDAPRKMLFLRAVGLTTQSISDKVIQEKMTKQHRALRGHSPSPLCLEQKQCSPLPSQVDSLSHSPDELNKASDFEEKKQFLALFNLKHLSTAQRKDIEETLLKFLCKSKKKYNSQPSDSAHSNRDPSACSDSPGYPDVASISHPSVIPTACCQEELSAQPQAEQYRPLLTAEASEIVSKDHTSNVNGNKSDKLGAADSGSTSSDEAEPSGTVNDQNEKFKLGTFLQEFQESKLESTKQQASDQPNVVDQHSDRGYNSSVQSLSLCDKLKQQVFQMFHQSRQVGPQPDGLDSEEEVDQQPKWKGVTAVLEAYQEYFEEKDLELQILQEQLKRLKERNHELNLTAEHLNAHMLDLQLSKQRYEVERQHQQAALCHLRKCLDLTHRLPTSSYRGSEEFDVD